MKRKQNINFAERSSSSRKKSASSSRSFNSSAGKEGDSRQRKLRTKKKEVYPLENDCHAWNVDGSSTDSLEYYSWIKFWEVKTGQARGICSFSDCTKQAEVGGHIWLKRKGPHIAPICKGCNYVENVKRLQHDDGKHSTLKKGTFVVRVNTTEEMKNAVRRIATPNYESLSSDEDEYDSSSEDSVEVVEYFRSEEEDDDDEEDGDDDEEDGDDDEEDDDDDEEDDDEEESSSDDCDEVVQERQQSNMFLYDEPFSRSGWW